MVEVCDICGYRGFSNALLECSECSVVYVHQYCLGIPPGSIDDTFDWVCEYCSMPVKSESCPKFGGIREIIALPEEPEDPESLCKLPPMKYHESCTIAKSSNLSKKQEATTLSFMEHPDSISKTVQSCAGFTGTIELLESKPASGTEITGYTNREVGGCMEKDDTPLLSASLKLDVEVLNHESAILESNGESTRLRESFEYPKENVLTAHIIGSSIEDFKKGTRERALEPEVEVIYQKQATVCKAEVYDEGPSSKPVGNSNKKHELMNQKTDRELSLRTALAHTKSSIRNKIVTMLLSAGWTFEYRYRKTQSRTKFDRVFVSPQGKTYWSVPRAYRKLEREVMEAKAKKCENGDGSGNPNICFTPLPKEFLSLFRKDTCKKKSMDREESNAKRELPHLGKRVENRAGFIGTMELHESKLQSPSQINARLCNFTNGIETTGYTNTDVDGCEENDDPVLLIASSELNGYTNIDVDGCEEKDDPALFIASSELNVN